MHIVGEKIIVIPSEERIFFDDNIYDCDNRYVERINLFPVIMVIIKLIIVKFFFCHDINIDIIITIHNNISNEDIKNSNVFSGNNYNNDFNNNNDSKCNHNYNNKYYQY